MSAAVQRIVVGTDGSAGARAAVAWAADEAALRGSSLVLAHAPHIDPRLLARLDRPLVVAVGEFAEVLLAEEAEAVVERRPEVSVHTLLCQGGAAEALINLSLDSELVVVGSNGIGEASRSMLGSVSHRVAAHASCPVVVVPAEVSPRLAPTGRVVAGATSGRSATVALRAAAEEASRRGASLVLVAVTETDEAGTGRPGDEATAGRLSAAAGVLDETVALLSDEHPGLAIKAELDSGEEAEAALLAAARDADLLVLGCHHSADPWSSRLGPVVSTVLHRSPCPVMLVGPPS